MVDNPKTERETWKEILKTLNYEGERKKECQTILS